MATRWIQLLQEEGFLAEDSSLSGESDWYPTQKLKHYLRHTGIEETVRFVMSISPAVEERSSDLAESDLAALADTLEFPSLNERPVTTGTTETQRLTEI